MSPPMEVPPDVEMLLALKVGNLEARITSVLEYIIPLEFGHSGQAPAGMVGAFLDEYRAWFLEEVLHALGPVNNPADLPAAIEQGVVMAAMRILRAIVDRTPVDTGRAKGSWELRLPDGTLIPGGPTITLEQQRAILEARRTSGGRKGPRDTRRQAIDAARDAYREGRR